MGVEPSARKRVLAADDDPDVCALLRCALGALAEVTTVSDAETALALLQDGPRYDALISDFMLPGIDGVELVASVRKKLPSLPILMVSGHGRAIAERARRAGVDEFLEKPFTLAQLRGALAALFHQRSARVA